MSEDNQDYKIKEGVVPLISSTAVLCFLIYQCAIYLIRKLTYQFDGTSKVRDNNELHSEKPHSEKPHSEESHGEESHSERQHSNSVNYHSIILKLMRELGYPISKHGICFGIASMAAQGALLGEQELNNFDTRLITIMQFNQRLLDSNLDFNPTNIEDFLKNSKEDSYWDVRAFLDGVYLYQYSYKKPVKEINETFSNKLRTNVSKVFHIVQPSSFSAELQFKQQDATCGYFNEQTLKDFLIKIDNHLKKLDKASKPIIFQLDAKWYSRDHARHAVAIVYFPNIQKYRFIDANKLSDSQYIELAKDIEPKIWEAYNMNACPKTTEVEPTIALTITIFGINDVFIGKTLLQLQNLRFNNQNSNGYEVLMLASNLGHLEVVKALLQQTNVDFNTKDREGNTALMLAVINRHNEIVKALLKRSNINVQNHEGTTALMLAASLGNLEITKELLRKQNIDLDAKNSKGETALMLATTSKHHEIVEELLKYRRSIILPLSHQARSLREQPSLPRKTRVDEGLLRGSTRKK